MGLKKSKYALKKETPVVSEENAMIQVMQLLERYDLDIEAIEDPVQKKALEKIVDNFLKPVMRGHMEVIEDDGELKVKQFIQHRSKGSTVESIVYGELTGETQDKIPDIEEMSKTSEVKATMGALCETENGAFIVGKLKSSDLKNMSYLGFIFLAL